VAVHIRLVFRPVDNEFVLELVFQEYSAPDLRRQSCCQNGCWRSDPLKCALRWQGGALVRQRYHQWNLALSLWQVCLQRRNRTRADLRVESCVRWAVWPSFPTAHRRTPSSTCSVISFASEKSLRAPQSRGLSSRDPCYCAAQDVSFCSDSRFRPRAEAMGAAAVQWAERTMRKIDGTFGSK